jgi:hypothetical protein
MDPGLSEKSTVKEDNSAKSFSKRIKSGYEECLK